MEVVNALLSAEAEVNKATTFGSSPLHLACWKGNLEVVKTLLAAGADVNKADKDGEIPLHKASSRGHLEVVDLLLRKGIHQGTYTLEMAERDNVVDQYRQIYDEQKQGFLSLKHARPGKNDEENKPGTELPLRQAKEIITDFLGEKTKLESLRIKPRKPRKRRKRRKPRKPRKLRKAPKSEEPLVWGLKL